jgi:desulfoferrodoxin (superoxide reductase-like protein)
MKKGKRIAWLAMLGMVAWLWLPAVAMADKAEASIEAPQTATKGGEITIRVTFRHSTNNPSHFTEWAKVMVNGKEVARWDFSPNKLPDGATFNREVKVKADGDLEVIAQANCNKHGSAGPAKAKITVK